MLDRRKTAAPEKYRSIDFKPPASVAQAAEKGLEYRRKSGKGGLSSQEAGKAGIGSGVQRAVNLSNRDNIAPDTIQQMLNFFSRHEKNKSIAPENRKTPWEDAGYVAWLLWGGDPGLAWAKKIKAQMEKADAEVEKKASSPLSLARDYGSIPEEKWGPVLPESKQASLRKLSDEGDSTRVGIFIPLPKDLAQQFPNLSEDPSGPHVTLLFVGDVSGHEDHFVEVVQGFFAKDQGPILARLAGLDYFSDQKGRVAYTRVHFSNDMGALRDRLSSCLQDAGFEVSNRFPLAYAPHVTLAYSKDPDFRWKGVVPQGEWSFREVELWGLPKVASVQFGSGKVASGNLLRLQQKRRASEILFRKWFGV